MFSVYLMCSEKHEVFNIRSVRMFTLGIIHVCIVEIFCRIQFYPCCLLKFIFIDLKVRAIVRKRDRLRLTDVSLVLVHSLNAHSSQGWAKQKLGSQIPSGSPTREARTSPSDSQSVH